MSDIKQLMGKAWSIIEAQQWDRLGEVFTATTEFRMPGQVTKGIDEFRGLCQGWWSAFPDMRHKVVSEIESGDAYACELVMIGTHKGTMQTPNGDIPATGRSVQMPSCDYVTVKDGRIATWHAHPDMMGMLAQISR